MRWYALGVDYEMAGKDLIDSVKLSGEICRAIGGLPPEGFNYELFLDEKGQKISKSKGNGLTIDEWLRYASPEVTVALHVSRAEGGEAALFRCHPAQCRRVSAIPRRLSAAGRQAAAVQSGLAHPFRQSAEDRHADRVQHAADAGVVVERGKCRHVVGLHRPLSSRRDAANASQIECTCRLCHSLFPRLRAAGKEIPRAERRRARRPDRSARRAVAIAGGRHRRSDPGRGL